MTQRFLFSLLFLAIAAPLWNCPAYEGNQFRYWLLDPATVNMNKLIAFSYDPDNYYHTVQDLPEKTWEEMDEEDYDLVALRPANYDQNILEWKAALGGLPTAADINTILYDTEPDVFFAGKYKQGNSFISALKKQENKELYTYLKFAKEAEAHINSEDLWSTDSNLADEIPGLIEKGQKMLADAKTPFVQQHLAFLIIKLGSYTKINDPVALYERYLKPVLNKSWVSNAAPYYIANAVDDPGQQMLWLARAWRLDTEHSWNIEFAFDNKNVQKYLPLATTNSEKADMLLISSLHYPGPALDKMQQVYALEHSNPALSMLLAREVCKLEDWLKTPENWWATAHIELLSDSLRPDEKLQHERDLQHLHNTRAFVQQVIGDSERPDPAFWYLSAAQLAFLDQDYPQARTYAGKGLAIPQIPKAQQIQLQLIDLLSDIAVQKTITDEQEQKAIQILDAISHAKGVFVEPGKLFSRVNGVLSELLIQQGDRAKGALLLSQDGQLWDTYAVGPAKNCFDKLLEIGTAADFDRALEILEHPKSPLEKWLVARPYQYGYYQTWNAKTGALVQKTAPVKKWETGKILDFKSMYYVRRDQLDSAAIALKNAPARYLEGRWQYEEYKQYYLYTNPFSVGLEVPGLELSKPDSSGKFNKISFLEKLQVLQQEYQNKPETAQLNCFLIGNAYYNMAYPGHNWFLMQNPYEGADGDSSNGGNWQIAPEAGARWTATEPTPTPQFPGARWAFTAIGLAGLAGFSFTRRKKSSGVLLLIALMTIGFATFCTSEDHKTPDMTRFVRAIDDHDQVYLGAARAQYWYKKGMDMNPRSNAGIICTYMLGVCDFAQKKYEFEQSRESWKDEFKSPTNPYLSKIKGAQYLNAVSCADFEDFLKTL